jgi:hypothetical protein
MAAPYPIQDVASPDMAVSVLGVLIVSMSSVVL